MTRRGWLLFAAMGLIWGIPYLLIKVAVGDLSPATLVFFRTFIGATLLLPIAALRGNLGPLRAHWKIVVVYTLIEVALPWFLLADAERRLSSSFTGLLVAAVPLVGAVLAWRTRTEYRLDRTRVAGLLIGFAGVAALLGLNMTGGDFGAVGEVAVVSVCYAVGPVIIIRRLSTVPAVGVVAASLGITALIYTPLGLLQMPRHVPSTAVLSSVVGLGVVCTALAFVVFFALIAEVGPVRATVITYVNPAVAVGLGVVLLHEPLTAGVLLGFAMILVGSVVTNRPDPRSRLRSSPPQPPGVAEASNSVSAAAPPAAGKY
jgi:drug/metabolite transporter (DMT)-like permease